MYPWDIQTNDSPVLLSWLLEWHVHGALRAPRYHELRPLAGSQPLCHRYGNCVSCRVNHEWLTCKPSPHLGTPPRMVCIQFCKE